jgi:hypothetical protein
MKILHLDIEMAPNLATVWGIWQQNIGINQLIDTARMICFAAKWDGERKIEFYSEYHHGTEVMIQAMYDLLEEADAVVHYNGKRFDMPHIQREFLEHGYTPPSPYHQIDLMLVVKKEFRFVSNKLDHLVQQLEIGRKLPGTDHQLWLDCMNGDSKAWKTMKKYNMHDVRLLEPLYKRIRPWIKNHPNHALYIDDDRPVCPNCGSHHVKKNGVEPLATQTYQRYKCTDCGTNIRGRTTVLPKEKRKAILTQSKL